MKLLGKFARQITKRRLSRPTAEEQRLIAALRHRVASLPVLTADASSAALTEWIQNRKRLRELIAQDDPRRFLEWDVIKQTMFVGDAAFVREELNCLRGSRSWRQRWRPALREDAIGLPQRCRYAIRSSGNLIHHAYSLFTFEQAVGKTIDQFSCIFEFGGGYGSFCRLAHRLGFRGTYLIFDLPEFSALQRFFLESVGVPISCTKGGSGVTCISDFDDLENRLGASSEWLLVGLWSLSETPVSLRQKLLGDGSQWGGYLISYQQRFGEVDNVEFFSSYMRQQRKMINWVMPPILRPPGNQYAFGLKRNRIQ
jgi:hypothetical protein